MKQNDVLKAIAIPSFKMLTAQDLGNVQVTIQNVLEDSDSLNDAQILSEDIITGLKNMKELLNIYVEQLVTSAEKELIDLAEKLGE